MKKGIQKAGVCIFCGGKGLTKQHVIPDWISEHLPFTRDNQVITNPVIGVPIGDSMVILDPGQPFVKEHNGSFGQRKIRNVCLTCNGGWMSRQEQKSMPLIESMMRGGDFQITRADAKAISIALALMTMMNEFTDPDKTRRAIPLYHRQVLKRSLAMPPNWFVGVGLMAGNGEPRARNHHLINPQLGRYVDSISAFHINTIRLNRLVFQAVVVEGFNYPVAFKQGQLKQVWPYTETSSGWQDGLLPISEDGFLDVADSLRDSMAMMNISKFSQSLPNSM